MSLAHSTAAKHYGHFRHLQLLALQVQLQKSLLIADKATCCLFIFGIKAFFSIFRFLIVLYNFLWFSCSKSERIQSSLTRVRGKELDAMSLSQCKETLWPYLAFFSFWHRNVSSRIRLFPPGFLLNLGFCVHCISSVVQKNQNIKHPFFSCVSFKNLLNFSIFQCLKIIKKT